MSQTDEQIVEMVSAALEYAMELASEEDGWKMEKEQENATVKIKKNKEDRKVWLCTATVNIAPKDLWDKLLDTDNLTAWNTTLTESKTIKTLDGDVKVSYQVTSEGGGGVVSARDFVYGSKILVKDGIFAIGGMSVEVSEQPEKKGCVRAVHGPGCQIVKPVEGEAGKSKFIWLMDCDYKGMIPSSIIEIAMPSAQLQMIDCISKLAA
eukprot:GFUD01009506.1.p1 GENE.GFUD01009506.1~~GFUD01009506.1.p1  ORF type:complete len:208 (-),score=79.00 GFUD01009506.1:121-744(-)